MGSKVGLPRYLSSHDNRHPSQPQTGRLIIPCDGLLLLFKAQARTGQALIFRYFFFLCFFFFYLSFTSFSWVAALSLMLRCHHDHAVSLMVETKLSSAVIDPCRFKPAHSAYQASQAVHAFCSSANPRIQYIEQTRAPTC